MTTSQKSKSLINHIRRWEGRKILPSPLSLPPKSISCFKRIASICSSMSPACFKDDHIYLFIGKSLLYFHPFSYVSTLLFFLISSVMAPNTPAFLTTLQSQSETITIFFNATWSLTITFFSNHIALSLTILGESKWIFSNDCIDGVRSLNVVGFISTLFTETALHQQTIT